jgi:hypothetical protein
MIFGSRTVVVLVLAVALAAVPSRAACTTSKAVLSAGMSLVAYSAALLDDLVIVPTAQGPIVAVNVTNGVIVFTVGAAVSGGNVSKVDGSFAVSRFTNVTGIVVVTNTLFVVADFGELRRIDLRTQTVETLRYASWPLNGTQLSVAQYNSSHLAVASASDHCVIVASIGSLSPTAATMVGHCGKAASTAVINGARVSDLKLGSPGVITVQLERRVIVYNQWFQQFVAADGATVNTLPSLTGTGETTPTALTTVSGNDAAVAYAVGTHTADCSIGETSLSAAAASRVNSSSADLCGAVADFGMVAIVASGGIPPSKFITVAVARGAPSNVVLVTTTICTAADGPSSLDASGNGGRRDSLAIIAIIVIAVVVVIIIGVVVVYRTLRHRTGAGLMPTIRGNALPDAIVQGQPAYRQRDGTLGATPDPAMQVGANARRPTAGARSTRSGTGETELKPAPAHSPTAADVGHTDSFHTEDDTRH